MAILIQETHIFRSLYAITHHTQNRQMQKLLYFKGDLRGFKPFHKCPPKVQGKEVTKQNEFNFDEKEISAGHLNLLTKLSNESPYDLCFGPSIAPKVLVKGQGMAQNIGHVGDRLKALDMLMKMSSSDFVFIAVDIHSIQSQCEVYFNLSNFSLHEPCYPEFGYDFIYSFIG